jgi:glyoxylase-like metal-dependent hydrolase (beta-lactamase superfamily II)
MAWHTVTPFADNVYRLAEPLGALEPRYGLRVVNMYLVIGAERAALIDTGMGIGDARALIRQLTSLPVTVLNTHSHWDHSGGNAFFDHCAIHPAEAEWAAQEPDLSDLRAAMNAPSARAALPEGFDPAAYRIIPKAPTQLLQDDEVIDLGGRALRALHTPGHSPGHVAFWDDAHGQVFTGDTAYRGPMFACFEGSDPAAFAQSARRLAALPDMRALYPGHEDVIDEPGWLERLADSAEAALAGRAPHRVHSGFMNGREFAFDSFSLWLP